MQSTKYGGLERYFIELVDQCNKRGYTSVFQYDYLPESAAYREDLAKLGAIMVVEKLGIGPFKVARLIARYKPFLVNSHFPTKAIIVWLALIAKALGVQRLIHIEHSLLNASKPNLSRFRVFGYNRYDQVLCVSNAILEFLADAGVKRSILSVLYLGRAGIHGSAAMRESMRAQFGFSPSDTVIGCIAWDIAFKGLDVLLRAIREVAAERPDVQLIIIGVDPKVSKLPALAKELGIAERVHWTGIRDAGWEVLNAVEIYVQPSRFAEGLSVATIEAMALSLPVVATRVAGPGEIVLHDETGILCAPDDVRDLVRGLLSMLRQPERWREMGSAGNKRYNELFLLDTSIATLIRAYRLA
jgi:glycosyltransferase involved in cell wall biosynthesis